MGTNLSNSKAKYILDNKFYLYSKIGSGATSKIYTGSIISDISNKLYALKIVNSTNLELQQTLKYYNLELSALTSLTHPSISTLVGYGSGQKTQIEAKKSKQVNYIILELIPNGELFDYIFYPKQGGNENKVTKILFWNIILIIEYGHMNNYSHRDGKTENIGIDNDFNVKLCDFGFSCNEEITSSNGGMGTHLGTPVYASPELLSNNNYYGKPCDIFALGVIGFVLVTGKIPFNKANMKDANYKYFYKGDYNAYWLKNGTIFSKEFKELFQGMCNVDPISRPSIYEIKACKWGKEGQGLNATEVIAGQQEGKDELERRFCIIQVKKHKNKTGNLKKSRETKHNTFQIEKEYKVNKIIGSIILNTSLNSEGLYKQIYSSLIETGYQLCPGGDTSGEIRAEDNLAKVRVIVKEIKSHNNKLFICKVDCIRYSGDESKCNFGYEGSVKIILGGFDKISNVNIRRF